jgi:type VI secretion system secreted protein VgrG
MGIEAERHVELHCPLGPDILLVRRFSGQEQLGRCFEYTLTLFSTDDNVEMESLLGQHASVRVRIAGQERFFDGIVCDFSHIGRQHRYALYRMTLRPWFWLLSRNQDCRVFQNESTVDILRKIFNERGFNDVEESLLSTYKPREYCVQYRESELDFISRLMEHEGIYYYFRHEKLKHTLVLADSSSAHQPAPGFETVHYGKLEDDKGLPGAFYGWSTTKRVRAGQVALNDYDFEKPQADLLVGNSEPKDHSHAEAEYFDYPGRYTLVDAGQDLARVRMQQLAMPHELAEGETEATGLFTGALFKLADHPRSDQNREYLTVGASYAIDSGGFESGDMGGPLIFTSRLTALSSKVPFRPERTTHTPIVTGAQTAVVVGPSGQEIWTDEYGRVKVQFHWDRDGKKDENSSCWVRVAQSWAGSNWGAIFIPRIGHEVVVEFLEGDPDQPLIIGSVYNKRNKPPYKLPKQQTQSGIKTQSTKDAERSEYNELRFEDEKGNEEVFIQAQKNLTTNVKNDSSTTIGNNHDHTVKKAMTVNVDEGAYKTTVSKDEMTIDVPVNLYRVKAQEILLESNGFTVHMDATGIALKCGGSEVLMTPALLTVNGTIIKMNG